MQFHRPSGLQAVPAVSRPAVPAPTVWPEPESLPDPLPDPLEGTALATAEEAAAGVDASGVEATGVDATGVDATGVEAAPPPETVTKTPPGRPAELDGAAAAAEVGEPPELDPEPDPEPEPVAPQLPEGSLNGPLPSFSTEEPGLGYV